LVADYRQRQAGGNPELARVRLAVDEWGIVRDWDPAPDGPGVGPFEHYYPLGDALASARALHELIRSADVVAMANWA
jgi:alpha-L-arabinofuranosidase